MSGAAHRAGAAPAPRGIRGERVGGEAAGTARLSDADCAALGRALRGQTGRRVGVAARPGPPLSRCRLSGHGVDVNVYLDTAHAAHQRYENRIVEQAQFGAPDPARVPHPVAGVGTPSAGEHEASWVPALSTLFAVRGNHFLTVAYAVAGWSRPRRLGAASDLARQAFRLGG
ncbi:MAG TPA: hypothetical protein VMT37_15530 [Solirubrobacterales bacterium]|nr:hypothetical protein [Solirubrobacterales bacterium]